MDTETTARFRRLVEDLIAGLEVSVGTKTDATATVSLDGSIGRISRVDALQSQQIALGLRARQQQRLQQLRQALATFAAGTYGICHRCRQPIALERLEAQPEARLCIHCAAGRSPRPGR